MTARAYWLACVLAFASAGPICGGPPSVSDGAPGGDDPDGGGGGGGGDGGGGGGDGGSPTDAPPDDPLCTDVAQCPGHATIIHAWGITNPPPYLWKSGYAPTTNDHCDWDPSESCRAIVESGPTGSGPPGPCCATGDTGCGGNYGGMWHAWIRDWWVDGWLPSIGIGVDSVRKFYVIYNRNGFWGGPHHNEDCEAILQLVTALRDAYRQCDTHVVVTTHSNGGVTFLWAWRDFIEQVLGGGGGGGLDGDRATTCTAKGRDLPDGSTPPLMVNGHLMQAAVGNGDNAGESASDFFPLHPYDTAGKPYWEPSTAAGQRRALLGVRFYYNHEDVMTYDFTGVSTVGRNEVLAWLDGTVDGSFVGAGFWQSHAGQAPYVALHACGHTSSHSSSMGAENGICGDLIIRNSQGSVLLDQSCAMECDEMGDWYDSALGPGFCLNPCHRNCWGPTAMTAIRIREPAVFADKFPFSFGNPNLRAMGGFAGWLDNDSRNDWRELFERQHAWCAQSFDLAVEQEPYVYGDGPKFGPLIDGRNDGSGQVTW
jgi:hypothetical protein